MSFSPLQPTPQRHRRLRMLPNLRDMVRETSVAAHQLIQPIFVVEGDHAAPLPGLPGMIRVTLATLAAEVESIAAAGVRAVLVFGVPLDEHKNAWADCAVSENGLVPKAVRIIRAAVPELIVITDVCLCAYQPHGHCGHVGPDGEIDNDSTNHTLARVAEAHAKAGAHMVAPSDMMDGRVAEIRQWLDYNGLINVPIMSYAAKFASALYGPFRTAAESAPAFGDRRSHQLDPANGREAHREAMSDAAEGADVLMVKPATLYLDVVARLRAETTLPIAVYHVSGEYAMLEAAAREGHIDRARAVEELLLSCRRAGADWIVTYLAKEWAPRLQP